MSLSLTAALAYTILCLPGDACIRPGGFFLEILIWFALVWLIRIFLFYSSYNYLKEPDRIISNDGENGMRLAPPGEPCHLVRWSASSPSWEWDPSVLSTCSVVCVAIGNRFPLLGFPDVFCLLCIPDICGCLPSVPLVSSLLSFFSSTLDINIWSNLF